MAGSLILLLVVVRARYITYKSWILWLVGVCVTAIVVIDKPTTMAMTHHILSDPSTYAVYRIIDHSTTT